MQLSSSLRTLLLLAEALGSLGLAPAAQRLGALPVPRPLGKAVCLSATLARHKPIHPDTPDWTLTPQQETDVDLLASGKTMTVSAPGRE